MDNGGCEQVCTNTNGSFSCSCGSGYSLDSNMLNCSGKISPVLLSNLLVLRACPLQTSMISSESQFSFSRQDIIQKSNEDALK